MEKKINRICEKICRKIVENPDDDTFTIDPSNIREYLGVKIFSKDRLYSTNMPEGISIGLGYNSIGGSILFIETSKSSFIEKNTEESEEKDNNVVGGVIETKKSSGRGNMILTGQLGDTMKESIQIAHTFSKNLCFELYGNEYLEQNDIHIHFPEGASKKDGPSAGITITSALVSLATGRPISGEIGMTGEISLNGKILKIGGLREKVLAAKREGLKKIIVPLSNKLDIEELDDNLKEGLEFFFVQEYEEAIPILFEPTSEKVTA